MSIARALSWPIRRLLDPRFKGLAEQADAQHLDLASRVDDLADRLDETMRTEAAATREGLTEIARAHLQANQEANELMARSLGDLLSELSATGDSMEAMASLLRDAGLPANLRAGIDTSVDELDTGTANFLNYASGHRGFAAQRGFWFNPPISLSYEAGSVRPADANERIVELPYVYRALGRGEPGSSVLDVGAAESTLAFSLASLGYNLTAVDLHPYPLSHPQLRSVQADILEWETTERFDIVLCISTLEHIGLGVYGDEPASAVASADRSAVERLRELTTPGGIMVLTVPFGAASADKTQRAYDRAGLERLIEAWTVEDLTIVRREDSLTWRVADENGSGSDGDRHVALVTARRPLE